MNVHPVGTSALENSSGDGQVKASHVHLELPQLNPCPARLRRAGGMPLDIFRLDRLFWDQRKGTSHNQDYDDLLGFVCPSCGWWKAIRETGAWGPPNPRRMPKFAYQKFCQAGCLKALSPGPPGIPVLCLIEEISFLPGNAPAPRLRQPGVDRRGNRGARFWLRKGTRWWLPQPLTWVCSPSSYAGMSGLASYSGPIINRFRRCSSPCSAGRWCAAPNPGASSWRRLPGTKALLPGQAHRTGGCCAFFADLKIIQIPKYSSQVTSWLPTTLTL